MALIVVAGVGTRALTLGWAVSGEIRHHDHVHAVMCENGAPGLGFTNWPNTPFWPAFGRRAFGPFWPGPLPCVPSGKALAESCSLDHPEIHRFGGIFWTEEVVQSFERAQADFDNRKRSTVGVSP